MRKRSPFVFSVLCGLLGLAPSLSASAAPSHPLEPLTQDELATVADRLTHYYEFPKGALFPMIALREPPKAEVKALKPGVSFRREAFATVLDRAANVTYDAV